MYCSHRSAAAVSRCGLSSSVAAVLAFMAHSVEAAPWRRRCDAEERCELFPPGWDREPSSQVYNTTRWPWMWKKSVVVFSEASAMPAIKGANDVASEIGEASIGSTSSSGGISSEAVGSSSAVAINMVPHSVASASLAAPDSGAFCCASKRNTSSLNKITLVGRK